MSPILTTARLRLRPRLLADIDANLAMDLDPLVMRYIRSTMPSRDQHRAELEARIRSGWPSIGGSWAVEWRESPGFLGWCGLFPLEDSGLIEIGYRYTSASWGQGIATEAGRAVLDHGFRVLGLDPIVAVVDPENIGSQRVIAKLGLRPRGTATHYGRDLNFYWLDASQTRGGGVDDLTVI